MSCNNRPGGGRRKSVGRAAAYLLVAALGAQVFAADAFHFNFFGGGSSSDKLDYNAQDEPAIRHPRSPAELDPTSSVFRAKRQAYKVSVGGGSVSITTDTANIGGESGTWGDWTQARECSRPCGGGVLVEERQCNGECTGPATRYVSCNLDACPTKADFRSEQCAQNNEKPLDGKYFKWIPYPGKNKCELTCKPDTANFYYKWADKVVDGTSCGDDAVCVDGVCLPLGCDGRLGSVAKKDKCGVCNGNETTCKGVDGLFEERGLQAGYHDVVTLPIGATGINISELHPTSNSLAIKNGSGHFYLNGNYQIHLLDKDTISAGGTTFKYSKAQPNGEPEKLSAPGPLEEELTIALLFQPSATAKTSGVKYEFAIPLDDDVAYYYKVGEWSACSVTCGKGVQTRTPYCIDAKSSARVEDELCVENNATKPEFEKSCETVNCEAEWFTADWEECSESCGNNGWQYRIVYCHKVFADGRKVTVSDGNCSESRPIVKQQCNRFSCPEWHAGPWSACSQKCGDAKQYRSVTCRSEKEGEEGRLLAADQCPASTTGLESERSCNLGPCEGLYFHTSEWNLCQRCNDTQETRNVTCRDQSGRAFPPEKCLNETINEIPVETRTCATQAPCTYEWHSSQWSKCSTECGHGHKSRKVHCAINELGDIEIVDESLCAGEEKPTDKEDCVNEAKCTGTYFTGPWSNCSAECDGGSHTRIVVCLNYDRKPVPEWCDESAKPADTENCNVDPCPTCENSTFGCCPDNSTFATGPSLEGCSNCSTSEFGCCADNYTTATGPNAQGCLEYEAPVEGSGEEDSFSDVSTTEAAPVNCEVANEETGETITVPCSATIPPPTVDEAAALLAGNDTENAANVTKHCSKTEHGCCADWYTPAEGPDLAGCPEIILGACNGTKHGCCPDNVTLARGPDFQGCGEPSCAASLYGCCKDRRTIAFGPHYAGCERSSFPCELSNFGCCPDGETAALDRNLTGCGASCLLTKFGCCPDLNTHAKGPNNEGCGCEYAQYGCCPDGKSSAQGPGYYGCPATCAQSQHGCCPDGKTSARGPQKEGCPCQYTRWGCCPDGETTALGPRNDGCDDCRYAKHGCCADGVSKAFGPDYAGCPTTTPAPFIIGGTIAPQKIASCNLPQDVGTACSAGSGWQTRWFYSTTDGRCAQFWFGGCGGGNENNYGSKEECEAVCERPPELGRCYLPKVEGPKECDQLAVRYWFDHTTRQCAAFWYRGCLGNANKFDTWEQCQTYCSAAGPLPVQPNRQSHPQQIQQAASQTPYGPPSVPHQQPQQPPHMPHPVLVPQIVSPAQPAQSGNSDAAKSREICGLRLDIGRCEGHFSSWYYEVATGLCEQFQYSGCGGNANRFHTKDQCENLCVRQQQSTAAGGYRGGLAAFAPATASIEHQNVGVMGSVLQKVNRFIENAKSAAGIPSVCDAEKDAGTCSRFVAKWFYNKADGTCNRFHYGGCDGNGNRFESEQDCKTTCGEHVDACLLPKVAGPCAGKVERFHFDAATGRCTPFVYGGCLGNTNNFGNAAECTARCGTAPKSVAKSAVSHEMPERCLQPKVIGPCRAMIDAYYYSTTLGECVEFDYGGCGGNSNRFYEREHCERTCRGGTAPSSDAGDEFDRDESLPVFKRRPREQSQPMLVYPIENSSYYYAQPLPVEMLSTDDGDVNTDGNSVDGRPLEPDAEEDVAEDEEDDENAITEFPTNPESLPDLCLQPEQRGDCYGEYLRWRYDSEARQCTSFLYSGCQQNANHFTSVEACQRACGAYRNQTVCQLPHNVGRCAEGSIAAPITRWFFDTNLRTCHAFMWSGCGGNGNRFVGKAECDDLCSRESQPQQFVSSSNDICSLPRDSGPCADQLTQWYFDAAAAACRPFTYGGCRGNANRFNSKALCQQRCVNQSQNDSEITIQSDEPEIVTEQPLGLPLIPERIRARVQASQPSPYLSGKSVTLRCVEAVGRYGSRPSALSAASYSWYWNEAELRRDEFANEFDRQRIEFSGNGQSIRIVSLKSSDVGDYSCVIGADGLISAPYSVVVYEAPTFDDCVDRGSPTTCGMVTRTGLCATARYGRFCCRTCSLKRKDDAE